MPKPLSLSCISGVARILRISVCRRSTTGGGVPAGTKIACHDTTSKSCRPGTPDSATVGTSGIEARRLAEVTAMARSLPLWMCGPATTVVSNIMSTCPPITSWIAGPLPLYGMCVNFTPDL
ncbi:hypothetical protein D3C71_919960 [compost metagenome]